jgi:hypothetical protein
VSEILGTLTTSESMFKYLGLYAKYLTRFPLGEGQEDKIYVIPQVKGWEGERGWGKRAAGGQGTRIHYVGSGTGER